MQSANIYMAKAPGNVTNWDGSGAVWFRVHEVPAIANGQTISFPAMSMSSLKLTTGMYS